MTDPAPVPAPPTAPTHEGAPVSEPNAQPAKTPPWGSDENFTPAKAWELIENLRKEKGGDTETLKSQVAAMQESQKAQQERLATALGLTEPPQSEDALAETVKNLQSQFEASQREANKLRIAAEKNIPAEYHDLLTETDPEKLSAQAEKVGALVAAHAAAAGTPAFQPNPGQGQGGGSATPEAQAEAEYAKFYPPSK